MSSTDWDNEEATRFMLAELQHTRQQLRLTITRFENLLTFYLTGMGFVVSAVAVTLASSQFSSLRYPALAAFGLLAWGLSLVIFTRLCITRVLLVDSAAKERRAQEYFLCRQRYLENFAAIIISPSNITDWSRWLGIGFSKQTVVLFYLVAMFAGLIASGTSATLLISISELSGATAGNLNSSMVWYLIVITIPLVATVTVCHLVLRAQQGKALYYARSSLSAPTSYTKK